jgi:hypothetical protein
MGRGRQHIMCAAFGLAILLLPAAARAADSRPEPDAQAVVLFDEGRRLMGASQFREAIPRFEESLRHARTVGALLNLGRCYEEVGRAASAWATFRAAAALARELHDAREAAADRFANAVHAKVATLTLDARALAGVAGARVSRDGVPLDAAERDTPAPVDPGEHVFEATAPGKQPRRASVTIAAGAAATVHLDALVDAPEPPSGSAPATAPRSSAQRTVGYVALAVGGGGIVVGAVGGALALAKHNQAVAACTSYPDHCPSSGAAEGPNNASSSWATVSTAGFIAGGAILAAGVAIVLTAPRERGGGSPAIARVSPYATSQGGGITVGGAW